MKGRGALITVSILVAVLFLLFRKSTQPDYILFSNDGPLGQISWLDSQEYVYQQDIDKDLVSKYGSNTVAKWHLELNLLDTPTIRVHEPGWHRGDFGLYFGCTTRIKLLITGLFAGYVSLIVYLRRR